jgi:hypothetical protein
MYIRFYVFEFFGTTPSTLYVHASQVYTIRVRLCSRRQQKSGECGQKTEHKIFEKKNLPFFPHVDVYSFFESQKAWKSIFVWLSRSARDIHTESHEEEKMVKIEINAAVAARTAKNVYSTQRNNERDPHQDSKSRFQKCTWRGLKSEERERKCWIDQLVSDKTRMLLLIDILRMISTTTTSIALNSQKKKISQGWLRVYFCAMYICVFTPCV